MKPTLLFLAALICFGSVPAAAEGGRLAFVVGVDQYENLPPEAQLSVAVADANRMKTTLESLDPPFTVRMVADGDVRGLESSFDAFLDEAKGAECALVYFAGHGVEYHGANFLLVKDTAISDISADVERMKRRLATEAISLQGWVDSLDATQAQVKVVILDCCRDNPLKAEDGSGTRAVVGASRGLAQVTPPSGTLISYSADAGQRANDGLFTEVLASNLKTPGLSILKVFAKTREEVREISTAWAEADASRGLAPDSSRSRHEPAEYNKLNLAGTDFAFTRGVPVGGQAAESEAKMSEVEIERRAKEMAERLVAEAMRQQPTPAVPTMPTETPKPMVRTDPVPTGAFPAGSGMEGSRAGEVREFGGIEMVWCPPGEFLMGSPKDEADRNDDETQHRVTLTRGFWMAKTETTQRQWESVMGTDVTQQKAKGDHYGEVTGEGATHPMYFVNWEDAQEYLEKMNGQHPMPLGWKWVLPTEAQWEYACRAGTERAFATTSGTLGDLDEMAWYDGNSGSTTNPVGTKKANAWGLHDMHGNVWEWCSDRYGEYSSGSSSDPTGATTGVRRVYRGGSWDELAHYCRSASRNRRTPYHRYVNLGFRPALVPSIR
jgi:formylglycine-generating enzyme required for sulfatase activity